jgi:hypothetical protein
VDRSASPSTTRRCSRWSCRSSLSRPTPTLARSIFDPFGGSGTTILAAQRTGRIARSVEIAPEYVDVAIQRCQQNCPDVPVTLVATGQTFAEVADEWLESGE